MRGLPWARRAEMGILERHVRIAIDRRRGRHADRRVVRARALAGSRHSGRCARHHGVTDVVASGRPRSSRRHLARCPRPPRSRCERVAAAALRDAGPLRRPTEGHRRAFSRRGRCGRTLDGRLCHRDVRGNASRTCPLAGVDRRRVSADGSGRTSTRPGRRGSRRARSESPVDDLRESRRLLRVLAPAPGARSWLERRCGRLSRLRPWSDGPRRDGPRRHVTALRSRVSRPRRYRPMASN